MLSFFYFQRYHIRPRRNSFQQLAKIAVDSFNKNGLNYPSMDYSTNISFFTGRIIHSVIQLREQRKEDVQIY